MYAFKHDEDEPGMVEVLPIEWWGHCEGELKALARHAEEHLAPGGVGWTDMYRIKPPPEELPRLGLTERRFVELMAPLGKRFDQITSTLPEFTPPAVGFGPGTADHGEWGNSGFIADLDGERVSTLWCRLRAHDDDAERKALGDMLYALNDHRPVLLVDWMSGQLVDLRFREEIDAYL